MVEMVNSVCVENACLSQFYFINVPNTKLKTELVPALKCMLVNTGNHLVMDILIINPEKQVCVQSSPGRDGEMLLLLWWKGEGEAGGDGQSHGFLSSNARAFFPSVLGSGIDNTDMLWMFTVTAAEKIR